MEHTLTHNKQYYKSTTQLIDNQRILIFLVLHGFLSVVFYPFSRYFCTEIIDFKKRNLIDGHLFEFWKNFT